MIKKLDIYIIKKFLGTFLFMIGAFVVILVIFDVSENIDDLVKSKAPFGRIVVDYYLNFAIQFGNILSSFIIFLTIIWFTSKLAQKSEIIAMLSGGISYSRILRPYFIASGILVLIALMLSHFVVPLANRNKLDFELEYLKEAIIVDERNLHREIEPGTIAYFYQFSPANKGGSQFSLEKWHEGHLNFKLIASGANYNEETKLWTINNATVREWDAAGNESVKFRNRIDTVLPMNMDTFGLRPETIGTMTYSELNDFIEKQRKAGSGDVAKSEIEKYSRTSNAFSIFVLTLIGASIASRKSRGGTGLHILLAVVIGFIYIFISRMMAVSAMTVGLTAAIAVWVPNILFFLIGIYLYTKAQK